MNSLYNILHDSARNDRSKTSDRPDHSWAWLFTHIFVKSVNEFIHWQLVCYGNDLQGEIREHLSNYSVIRYAPQVLDSGIHIKQREDSHQ